MGLWAQRRRRLGFGHRVDSIGTRQDIVFLSRRVWRLETEQSIMNKDQVKGTAKDVVGKVQEEAGKLAGNKEQQIKGLSKQISGKAQKGLGDVKQAVDDLEKS
jgi:uncharacterized protein YjbJ (UPF0337 family)